MKKSERLELCLKGAAFVEVYMTRLVKRWEFPAAVLLVFIILPVFLGSCGNVIGFGDPVDFIPPELTLGTPDEPLETTIYVRTTTRLFGTCYDNVAVARVICRDSMDKNLIYGTVNNPGNTWSMRLNFTSADNGRKIPVEIVAFDRAGNSGELSIAFVNLIIDLKPPMYENIMIWRSDSRFTLLADDLSDLRALETSDPKADKLENVEKYQNGVFWIRASVIEDETSVKSNPDPEKSTQYLMIFDPAHYSSTDDPKNPKLALYSMPFTGTNAYSPEWIVTAKELIEAGDAKCLADPNWRVGGNNYTQRLVKGPNEEPGRLYFRIVLTAEDLADNPGLWGDGKSSSYDDYGYFCLAPDADIPSISRPGGGGQYVDVGTPLPVQIFDDDAIEKAYVGLLKKAVFDVYPGVDEYAKLEYIKNNLTGATPTILDYKGSAITNKVAPGTPDNLLPQVLNEEVIAGVDTGDYGEYILFGIALDKKSNPHTAPYTELSTTNGKSAWGYFYTPIYITDSNAPIIVIDTVVIGGDDYDSATHVGLEKTVGADNGVSLGVYGAPNPNASTGNSPEENTFPEPLSGGRYFAINGFTLRPDEKTGSGKGAPAGRGEVTVFRMAWVPNAIANETTIKQVEQALANDAQNTYPAGVQFWELSSPANTIGSGPTTKTSYWTKGQSQLIPNSTEGSWNTKQSFKKTFDVLGGPDDLNTSWNNFTYNSVRENDAKLFIFYARDQGNTSSTRSIRLLGNTTPPTLRVYDSTPHDKLSEISLPSDPPYNPDIQEPSYDAISGRGDVNLELPDPILPPPATKSYTIEPFSYSNDDISIPFKAYPRNKVNMMYAIAVPGEIDLDDEGIKMYDITYGDPNDNPSTGNRRGYYNSANRDLTYIAALPDLLQRVFLFTAKNKLGVEVRVQRTIAVTATAYLEEIITPLAGGTTYSAGTAITLQAHFSGLVRVVPGPGSSVPRLNIRYQIDGTSPSGTDEEFDSAYPGKLWKYTTVNYSGDLNSVRGNMYLDFAWTVPSGANGILETIDLSSSTAMHPNGRPIALNGASIQDVESEKSAYLVGRGSVSEPDYIIIWEGGENSLQGTGPTDPRGKEIVLDGIQPTVTAFIAGGKTAYTGPANPPDATPVEPPNHYYFKAGETIFFTLTASKEIRTAGNPRIAFRIRAANGTVGSTVYYADYVRPAGPRSMLFSYDVTASVPADGIADGTVELAPNGTYGGVIVTNGLNSQTTNDIIVDMVGNQLDSGALISSYASSTVVVRVDKTDPPVVNPVLTPAPNSGPLNASITNLYQANPKLTMSVTPTTTQEPWGAFCQYSLDGGLSWVDYPDTRSDWTELDGAVPKIKNGQWRLVTRYMDKAGNYSPSSLVYNLDINGQFPELEYISIKNSQGIWTEGPITFTLDFAARVKTTLTSTSDPYRAYIIVSDMDAPGLDTGSESTVKVYADRLTTPSSTLTFSWNSPLGQKQMPGGLTITAICLKGDGPTADVEDLYGNSGVNSWDGFQTPTADPAPVYPEKVTMYKHYPPRLASEYDDLSNTYQVTNLNGDGVIVDAITPFIKWDDDYTKPKSGEAEGNVASIVLGGDRKAITLVFSENVRKEQGTISIKPWGPSNGNFPIPPVIPMEGKYLADGTYVASLFELYSVLGTTDRGYLIGPSRTTIPAYAANADTGYGTYEDPLLDGRTGLYKGPYKLTTQGLVPGAGYAANNTAGVTPNPLGTGTGSATINGGADTGWNAVLVTSTNPYMVPDLEPKFVLDYQYSIHDTTAGGVVANIRTALRNAKFRVREIDVISADIKIGTMSGSTFIPAAAGAKGNVVQINLATPLEEGLQWTLSYPFGTFTDDPAGNPAAALADGAYWFWTDGVQTPVIRVDRKSLDNRADVHRTDGGSLDYQVENITSGSVGILDTINFKVESETPGATVTFARLYGTQGTGVGVTQLSDSSITLPYNSTTLQDWSGGAGGGEYSWAHSTVASPKSIVTQDTGTWVLKNLLHRGTGTRAGWNGNYANSNGLPTTLAVPAFYVSDWTYNKAFSYTVVEDGTAKSKDVNGNFWGLRSFNRDPVLNELKALSLGGGSTTTITSSFSIGRLAASKNYVVAKATAPHNGATKTYPTGEGLGFEGVFKTVVALHTPQNNDNKFFGSANGGPPIQIMGSNTESPAASLAGFPLMMGNGDLRYLKVVFPLDSKSGERYYWASTEIVSPWYITFASKQNSNNLMSRPYNLCGDAGVYLSGGYGDLTYSFNQDFQDN